MTLFEYAIINKKVKEDLFVEARDKYSDYRVTIKSYDIKYGTTVELEGHKFTFDNSMCIKLDDDIEINKGDHYLISNKMTIEFTATYNKTRGYGFYATIKIATC